MSLFAASVAENTAPHTNFDSLRLGQTTQFIVGRLLRFWDSRNISNGDFMGITVLLLDEKNSMIHGFISAGRANHYRESLTTGAILRVDRFAVARCTKMYKITHHPFVIRFIRGTTIDEVETAAPVINLHKFMIRQLDHLLALANTDLEFPDVVGQIRSVQGSELSNPADRSRILIRLLIDCAVTVFLNLSEDAASTFRSVLNSQGNRHSVMVVTTTKPQLFAGNLHLHSTAATTYYFDSNITAIQEFTISLGDAAAYVFPCIERSQTLEKKQLRTIKDLYSIMSTSMEHDAHFICQAWVVGINRQNGWSYVSCNECSRALGGPETGFMCNNCVTRNVDGVLRYRVELSVSDGDDTATFVVFDNVMKKLTNQYPAARALEEVPSRGSEEIPKCLEELTGKSFDFHLRVTPLTCTQDNHIYTVYAMTETVFEDTSPQTLSNREATGGDIEAGLLRPSTSNQPNPGGKDMGVDNAKLEA